MTLMMPAVGYFYRSVVCSTGLSSEWSQPVDRERYYRKASTKLPDSADDDGADSPGRLYRRYQVDRFVADAGRRAADGQFFLL